MKKVIFFNNIWPNEKFPNVGTYAKSMSECLMEAGADVDLCVLNETGNKLLDYARLYWRLATMPLPKGAVLYINHYLFLIPLLLRLLFIHRRMICHWHGEELVAEGVILKILRRLSRLTFRDDTLHVSPSRYYAGIVAEVLGVKKEEILISPSGGVDSEVFRPLKKLSSNNSLNIGYSAALTQAKGMDYLLEIIKNTKTLEKTVKKKVQFHVINYGSERDDFRRFVDRLNANEYVKLHSPYRKNDLSNFYKEVDLLLFLSARPGESLGLTVLEAMSCDVPVIARNVCAMNEMVVPGENGEIVGTIPTVEEIMKKIIKVASHLENYTPRERIKKYERREVVSFYQGLIAKQSKVPFN